jgi:hypothetical protein
MVSTETTETTITLVITKLKTASIFSEKRSPMDIFLSSLVRLAVSSSKKSHMAS